MPISGIMQIPGITQGQMTACIAGDSRVQRNIDQASVGTHGGFTIKNEPYWFTTLQWIMGQPFVLVNNAGVNSDTVAGLLSRIDNGSAGSGFGAIGSSGFAVASSPGCLGLVSGVPKYTFVAIGINDILNGASAAAIMGAGGAGCTAGILCIWQHVINKGSTVIAMTIEPATTSQGGWTPASAAQWYLLNQQIKTAATTMSGVILADVNAGPSVIDVTNANITGLTGLYADGTLHENSLGAYYKAKALKTYLSPYVPPVNRYLPTANAATSVTNGSITQLLANPLLTGSTPCTGAGMSGNGPSPALTYVNTNATSICSIEARGDGFGQNLVLDVTSAGAGGNIEVRWPDQHASVVQGAGYVASAQFCVTGPSAANLSGSNNLSFVRMAIQYNDGANNSFSYDGDSTYPANYVESYCGTLQTPVTWIVPSGGVDTTFRIFVDIQFSGAGEAVVHLGRISLNRVS